MNTSGTGLDHPAPPGPGGGILCRDCLVLSQPAAGARCPACRSPRIVSHTELADLSIAHIDCDAFYAAIEKRDDPNLADKPVIIGGGRRGVVSTACYVARTYGIRSAMPMFKALAACPHAVVIKPNMEKYAAEGRRIRAMMNDLTPLVQAVSIDEAFLDLSGTQRLHRAPGRQTLARFARRVEDETGLGISVGLSYNKFLAKIASDLDKPRGFAVIGRAEAVSFLRDRPVGIFPGVGHVTQERLAKDGFATVGDLQRLDASALARRYGEEGLRLWRMARGEDSRPVRPDRETKSISAETTFDADLGDAEFAPAHSPPAEREGRDTAAQAGFRGAGRDAEAQNRRLPVGPAPAPAAPTQLASRLYDAGRELLVRELDGTRSG